MLAVFLLRRWPWLMVAVLSLASLLTLLLSDRSLRVLVPALFAVHATIITVGIRRRPDRDRVTWMALQIATILLVPRSLSFVQYRVGGQSQGWQTATVAALLAILVCFGWAATRGFWTVAARSRHRPTGQGRPGRVCAGVGIGAVDLSWRAPDRSYVGGRGRGLLYRHRSAGRRPRHAVP